MTCTSNPYGCTQPIRRGYVVVGLLTALVCGRSYSWSNGGFSLPDIVSGLVAGVKDVSKRWVAALAEGRSEGCSSGFSVHA